MNLIDAIKSGKPFRRKDWNSNTCLLSADANGVIHCSLGTRYLLSTHEILATDWEIEEKSVTITGRQLLQAMAVATLKDCCSGPSFAFRLQVLKELGLEDK